MTTAEPSESTKPSRSLSKGRDACSGSSLRRLIACMVEKAPIASGSTAASEPPATTDAGGDGGAGAVGCFRDVELRVLERLRHRADGELREAVGPSRVLAVHVLRRLEVLHLPGDLGLIWRGIESRDPPDPSAPLC